MKPSGNRCECTACGEYFSSIQAFDRHRVGQHGIDRRCLTVSDLTASGWSKHTRGHWVLPGLGRVPADIEGPSAPPAAITLATPPANGPELELSA